MREAILLLVATGCLLGPAAWPLYVEAQRSACDPTPPSDAPGLVFEADPAGPVDWGHLPPSWRDRTLGCLAHGSGRLALAPSLEEAAASNDLGPGEQAGDRSW